MCVEDVAGVRFATGRPPQEERDLAVRHGMLRQVVVDDERVVAAVGEVLGHRAAGVRRQILHRRRRVGVGDDDDRVRQGIVAREGVDDARDRRCLLADRDVDADDVLALLVDDRVERDRRLARPAVADDQLALAAADRRHRVDGLEPCLKRRVDRLAIDDARRLRVGAARLRRRDRPAPVERAAERIDDTAEEGFPDRRLEHAPGAPDLVAFFHLLRVAEQRDADRFLFEVEDEAVHVVLRRPRSPTDIARSSP